MDKAIYDIVDSITTAIKQCNQQIKYYVEKGYPDLSDNFIRRQHLYIEMLERVINEELNIIKDKYGE